MVKKTDTVNVEAKSEEISDEVKKGIGAAVLLVLLLILKPGEESLRGIEELQVPLGMAEFAGYKVKYNNYLIFSTLSLVNNFSGENKAVALGFCGMTFNINGL